MEALWRLENELPPWINTRTDVIQELAPEDCQAFGMDLQIEDEDRVLTLDSFSERYIVPMVAWMLNHLGDLRAKAGADHEIVFYRAPLMGGDIWSEEIRSKRVAMRLRKRYLGDQAHFDLFYKIQKIEKAVAA